MRGINLLYCFVSILLAYLLTNVQVCNAQVENVIIEKYYISDATDATDTTLGSVLEPGSVTYRIYIDLAAGSKLLSIYGDTNHPIMIKSTAPFYNNTFQPGAGFGYLLNRNLFISTPTLALDSWLTLGNAAKNQSGVLKTYDTDGNFFAGSNNLGGSSLIPGGILNNADTAAGIPLTSADGLMTNTTVLGTWLENGFKDALGNDTTAFGGNTSSATFISYNSSLQQSSGVKGAGSDSSIVLVAQLTTKGELSFKLNIAVQQIVNGISTIVKYVSGSDVLLNDEVVSPLLTYPAECGCKDPDYFEYDAAYGCSIQDSCKTKIHFGCRDTVACNYDPEANFHVQELCCYPGLCQDRDIAQICPDLSNLRTGHVNPIFPNPANQTLNVSFIPGEGMFIRYSILNSLGTEVLKKTTGSVSGSTFTDPIDISSLPPGVYFLMTDTGKELNTQKFIKGL